MNRRDLLRKVAVGSTVLVLVPSVLKSCTKAPLEITGNNPTGNAPGSELSLDLTLPDYSVLNSAGGSKVVQGVIVVNTGSKFIALSSTCTHQGCTVGYDSPSGNIKCPCHGSQFTTSGSIVNGPAPTPLKSYAVTQTGNILTITF
jgi:cytochrome b6-f complex iron-sulfur subunit